MKPTEMLVLLALVSISLTACEESLRSGPSEPTRASESEFNHNITKAHTSRNLSNADLAWHAQNTYGWNCEEVTSREPQTRDFFVVTCSSGTRLRVYPRNKQHPKITNDRGGYE